MVVTTDSDSIGVVWVQDCVSFPSTPGDSLPAAHDLFFGGNSPTTISGRKCQHVRETHLAEEKMVRNSLTPCHPGVDGLFVTKTKGW